MAPSRNAMSAISRRQLWRFALRGGRTPVRPCYAPSEPDLLTELDEMDCQLCHGPDALGVEEKGSPQLIAQHPRYLVKQIADFRDGARWHELAENLFGEAYEDELDAVLADILHLNHQPPVGGG